MGEDQRGETDFRADRRRHWWRSKRRERFQGGLKAAWVEIKGNRWIKRESKAAWVDIKEKREKSLNSEGGEVTMGAERIEDGRKNGKCENGGVRQQARVRAIQKLEISSWDMVCGEVGDMGETLCG